MHWKLNQPARPFQEAILSCGPRVTLTAGSLQAKGSLEFLWAGRGVQSEHHSRLSCRLQGSEVSLKALGKNVLFL